MSDSNLEGDKNVRVLVVEDDPHDRELLLHQLRKGGMDDHVKFLASGKEALEFLTGPRIKAVAKALLAIFLDLKLPELGGIELLRRLRQYEEYVHIPVIVMTSSNDPKDLDECHRLKVAKYIPKPVTFASFSKSLADAFHPPPPKSFPL
jgi:two-component system response regulator